MYTLWLSLHYYEKSKHCQKSSNYHSRYLNYTYPIIHYQQDFLLPSKLNPVRFYLLCLFTIESNGKKSAPIQIITDYMLSTGKLLSGLSTIAGSADISQRTCTYTHLTQPPFEHIKATKYPPFTLTKYLIEPGCLIQIKSWYWKLISIIT
jgi:hypothetical protein